jgi:hypothetical protein
VFFQLSILSFFFRTSKETCLYWEPSSSK